MQNLFRYLTGAACAALLAIPATAQTVTRHDISFDTAKQIADAAMADCAARGATVAVHVVDSSGNIILSYRADGSRPHIFQVAFEKAYTAMSFQRPTQDMSEEYAEGNPNRVQQADFPNTVFLGGGLPIIIDGETVGGVGVAGTLGPISAQCAQAGLDAVADQL